MSNPITMVATCRQMYKGRPLTSGTEFDVADDMEANDMEAVRTAVRKKKVAAPAVADYATREMTPTEPADATPAPRKTLTAKGRHERRDMRAAR